MPSPNHDAPSSRPGPSAREWARPALIFCVLSVLLLAWVHVDRAPAPVYRNQNPHPGAPTLAVTRETPLELELQLERGVRGVLVPVWTEPDRRPLSISVWTATSGAVLAEQTVTQAGVTRIPVAASSEQSEALVLRFASEASAERDAPRVMWAKHRPRNEAIVLRSERPLEPGAKLPLTGPLVVIEYASFARYALLLWPGVLLPLAWAWRDPRRTGVFLVTLGLLAALTSTLLWQRDYARRAPHIDADDYARSASELARWLKEPGARDSVRAWFRDYPHSTSMAVPALMALPVAMGLPALALYTVLAAWAGFLCLLLFQRLMSEKLALAHPLPLVATVLFGTHLLMLRSFARPITDVFGLALVLATLWIVLRRLEGVRPRDELLLGLLILAHPLARPQGLGYWPFIALAVAACDGWRTRAEGGVGQRAPSLLAAQLRLFLPPLLLIAGLYGLFGWAHNARLMMDKASRFEVASTWPALLRSTLGLVQLLPLLWLGARGRLRSPAALLFVAWALWCVALLLAVDAPFWMRHLLPILPTVVLLAALGLDASEGAMRRAGWGLAAVTVLWNVGVTIHQALHFGPISPALEGLINTP